MDFLYILASGALMEPVDVLGNDSVKLSGLLHLRKLIMRPVGHDILGIELLPVELIENVRVIDQAINAEQILR